MKCCLQVIGTTLSHMAMQGSVHVRTNACRNVIVRAVCDGSTLSLAWQLWLSQFRFPHFRRLDHTESCYVSIIIYNYMNPDRAVTISISNRMPFLL